MTGSLCTRLGFWRSTVCTPEVLLLLKSRQALKQMEPHKLQTQASLLINACRHRLESTECVIGRPIFLMPAWIYLMGTRQRFMLSIFLRIRWYRALKSRNSEALPTEPGCLLLHEKFLS